jgi:hypothetical protein
MLVTVVPARTAKFPADPRNTALCCWAMAIGQRLIALRLGTMERAVRTPAYIAMWAALFDKGIPYLRGLFDEGIPYLVKAVQLGEERARYTLAVIYIKRGESRGADRRRSARPAREPHASNSAHGPADSRRAPRGPP